MIGLALLLSAAALLLAAARRQRRRSPARTAAGLGGLAVLGAAFGPGLDDRSAQLLSAHMLQHALVGLVAAPLLVAAAPVRLALGALPRETGRSLVRLLHRPWVRVLAHPLCGLAIYVAVLAVVHLPAVYEAALRTPALHGAEHAALLWSAIALWAPLVGADPLPHRAGAIERVGVLVAAMTAMAVLGAVLAASHDVVYASYVAPAAALGRDPLADQALAGGVMWIGGMVVVLPALLGLAWSALAREERRQRARESAGGGR
ncbi:MAG: putative rane protein [Solirubrobacteraceae bacterium]|nr:putative rane protein [Solirubrobacteraceae bacterium]